LEQDLSFGATWRVDHSLPAGEVYVQFGKYQTSLSTLIAHSYTRYIGDLSGGQILKGIAERAMNPLMDKGLLSTNSKTFPMKVQSHHRQKP